MSTAAPDILLVEDCSSDIELFEFALQINKSALTFSVARDGVEAVALLLGEDGSGALADDSLPRVVLLDLNMPRLNGFQVLEQLRAHARTRNLVVVVFSASDQIADEHEARRLGANDYVRKPAGFEQLCQTVADIECKWLRANPAASPPAV